MNTHHNYHPKNNGLRGFVAFVAAALWFLLTILASAPANAESAAAAEEKFAIELVRQALIERGAAPSVRIELDNPYAADSTLEFSQVIYNAATGRFFIRRANNSLLTGSALEIVQAPMLRQPISRGEVIAENDIVYSDITSARGGVVLDAADLIGKEARRPLPAATAIRANDVVEPVLVKKGALISLSYVQGGLRLTHQGVALSNGSTGDIVTVKNPQSDVTIKAIVEGKNQARAFAPAQQVVGG